MFLSSVFFLLFLSWLFYLLSHWLMHTKIKCIALCDTKYDTRSRLRHISSSGRTTYPAHSRNMVRIYLSTHRFFSKNSKITISFSSILIMRSIIGYPEDKILRSSRLELIGSWSDRLKGIQSRPISPSVLVQWLIQKLSKIKHVRKCVSSIRPIG